MRPPLRSPSFLVPIFMPAVLAVLVTAHVPRAARAESESLWTTLPRSKKIPTLSLADLADRARPAVVHVRGTADDAAPSTDGGGESSRTSIGTGFLIHKDGYIVTNEHVIRAVTDLRIRLYDGRELPACVVGVDSPTDIALVKIDAGGPLPVLPLGDSDSVRVGETVVAIGNPYGFNHSVTAGIVSAKERVVDRSTLHEMPQDIYSFFIQTDASINLGNSGGPLIDAAGAVIGVNAAFWAGHPLQPAQGIGFAIPINMAKSLLPRLRDKGDAPRSFLGVDAQPIDSALAVALKMDSTRGALIASVEKKSPAEAAGLEPGDVVLTWNGTPIATSEDLKIDAQLTLPGTRAKVGLLREGKRIDREVTTRPAVSHVPPAPHPAGCARKRLASADAANQDFDVADVPSGVAGTLPGGRGIAISQVSGHGAAAQAGLKVGDVILRIGRDGIRTQGDLTTALHRFKLGDAVPVLVRRSGFDFWTALTRR